MPANLRPILDFLMKQLRSQSSHSAIILLAILMLAAKAAGVDLVGMSNTVTEVLTALGALSAAFKVLMPDAPTVPPDSVIVTPPPAAEGEPQ